MDVSQKKHLDLLVYKNYYLVNDINRNFSVSIVTIGDIIVTVTTSFCRNYFIFCITQTYKLETGIPYFQTKK